MTSALTRHRGFFIGIFHFIVAAATLTTAFWLRFDLSVPVSEAVFLYRGLLIAVPVKTVVFALSGVHKGRWRFVSMADLFSVFYANLLGSVAFTILTMLLVGTGFPRSVYFIDFLICFLGTAGGRFALRLYHEAAAGNGLKAGAKNILIYGAGAAGRMLLVEIHSNPSVGYKVVGFLDDNRRLQSTVLMNLPVLGTGRDAAHVVDRFKKRSRKIEEIIIAMPSATGRQMREALANCRAAGVACKTIPGLSDLLKGQVLSTQIRNLSLEDLLGRKPVRLEEDRIAQKVASRSILVTGASGSIGSELCRQVAGFGPTKLVAFDQAESELYRTDLELREKFPSLEVVAELGDIRDARRVDEVIRRHAIDSVFHAAAYKHVPMMEAHILEAVRNNVLGTWNIVRAAAQNQVSDFLMISSDKAVNPTSIMGVTKRIAELIVSANDSASQGTKFVSVRFGNVLGSNGSVVPLFQAQIAAGGPVTVTHPEMRRYFMSVREAVQLVLQASTIGKGSEIFVLDMGEPIKILDLANNMIRLAGLVPGEDIEIRIVGSRPGEKLYEELNMEEENLLPTHHEKIKIFKGPSISRDVIERWLFQLRALIAERNAASIVVHLKRLVPEYLPPLEVKESQPVRAALARS